MNTQYNILRIKNVDTADFLIEYNKSDPINAFVAILKPGEVRSLPRFIADHIVGKIIDQVLNRMGIATTNEGERGKLMSQIIVEEEVVQYPAVKTPEQIALDKAEELNREQTKASELDKYLNKHKPTVPVVPVQEVVAPVQEPGMLPEISLDEEPAQPVVPVQTDVPATNAPIVTRPQLYDYARNVLKMNLDDAKTMGTYENMSVPELMKELDYSPEQ